MIPKGLITTIHSVVPSLLCQKDSVKPKLTREVQKNAIAHWDPLITKSALCLFELALVYEKQNFAIAF